MQELGPFVIFSHEEGDFELGMEEILKKKLTAQGIPLNNIVCTAIKNFAKEEGKRVREKLRSEGFPENIQMLLDSRKKKDTNRIAKQITISNSDIARMVFNCDFLGFKHSRKHKWFYPDDVIPTEQEHDSFSKIKNAGPIIDKNAKKFVNKILVHYRQHQNSVTDFLERRKVGGGARKPGGLARLGVKSSWLRYCLAFEYKKESDLVNYACKLFLDLTEGKSKFRSFTFMMNHFDLLFYSMGNKRRHFFSRINFVRKLCYT